MNFLSHLECGLCGKTQDADKIWNLCPECQKPLLVRYDLEAAARAFTPEEIKGREPNLWRYHEVLPIRDHRYRLCLGEGFTPLFHARRLGEAVEFEGLYIKDEGGNPTGSFKARGMATAVTMARRFGARRLALPSAGNAGGAAAAYGALAGLTVDLFLPDDTPMPFRLEAAAYGATVHLVDGDISDCGIHVREGSERGVFFDREHWHDGSAHGGGMGCC